MNKDDQYALDKRQDSEILYGLIGMIALGAVVTMIILSTLHLPFPTVVFGSHDASVSNPVTPGIKPTPRVSHSTTVPAATPSALPGSTNVGQPGTSTTRGAIVAPGPSQGRTQAPTPIGPTAVPVQPTAQPLPGLPLPSIHVGITIPPLLPILPSLGVGVG